jgi:alkylhydroperoxidase family enzyme
MPRIPYVPTDIAEPADVVNAIRARRGGGLMLLDRQLLHSPALAAGWNTFLGAIRTQLSLPPRLRELAMCGVAVLNGADYEFVAHAPLFIKEGGTQLQVDALREVEAAAGNQTLFNDAERATLWLTLQMTRDVAVDNATFDRVAKALAIPQQVVELVAVIAAYNMVSRFLVALDVHPEKA